MKKENTADTELMLALLENMPSYCRSFIIGTKSERTASTRLGYTRDINEFLDYLIGFHPNFKDKVKAEITEKDLGTLVIDDINEYISMQLDNHSPATVARRKSALSAFFNYLVIRESISKSPVVNSAKITQETKDYVIYINLKEQEKLMQTVIYGTGLTGKALTQHKHYALRDTALIYLFLDTGMRISEINGMDIRDINFDECSVRVRRKGNKVQTIYFSDQAKEYLLEYINSKGINFYNVKADEPLFTTRQDERLSIRQIRALVEKYVKAALPERMGDISPHKLRSSFAMAFLPASDYNMPLLQEKLGHKRIETTTIYAKATEKEARDSRNLLMYIKDAETN